MRRTKTGLLPRVDVFEPRLVLSNAGPLLSSHALAVIRHEVSAIATTLARTGNTARAGVQLDGVAAQVPTGSAGLAPLWHTDLVLYHPGVARSINTLERRLIGDLNHYDLIGGNESNDQASGSNGATATTPMQGAGGATNPVPSPTPTPTPTPTPSPDSVQIENTTGLAIVVTVHLNLSPTDQRKITETIPANGDITADFDFGSASGAFMTMDVSAAIGKQAPPPPWNGINLAQPLGGYNGVLYTISLFGPYFSVSDS